MTIALALRLLAVMGLWAACFPLITAGLGLAPQLTFAAMRAALAGTTLLAFGFYSGRPMPRGRHSWQLIGLVGLGATTMGFLGMFQAAEFVSPGLATVIANTQPLLAAVLAHAFLDEKLSGRAKLGLVAGLAGIVAIAFPGFALGNSHNLAFGIGYVLIAAAGVSVGNVAIKRLTGKVDAVMAMGFQLLLGAGPLAIIALSTEDVGSVIWSIRFITVLVALAVFGTALAFWLWFGALERVDLNRANAFTFLVPILGLIIGATLFHERVGWIQALGIALVLSGIGLVQMGSGRSKAQ